MIKWGIVSRDERARKALRDESAHKGWWPFAYSLLSEVAASYSPEDEALIERLYRSMRSGDGVYKITRRGRFEAFDREIVAQAQQLGRSAPVLHVHDMAASSAITSLEFFELLARSVPVKFRASDWFDRIYVVQQRNSRWKVVFDAVGDPLQLQGYGLVLSAYRPESPRYPVNRLIQEIVKRRLVSQAKALLGSMLESGAVPEPSLGSVAGVSLFHPLATMRARTDPAFTLARDDLFRPIGGSYDMIRVMNALTTHHFSIERIKGAIEGIGRNLEEGGLLVLGRNVDEGDGRLRASMFRRRGERLTAEVHAAEPYELADLATAAQLAPFAGRNGNTSKWPQSAPSST